MPRLIFCIAILILVLIALCKVIYRAYWRIRNHRNHCKGRVVRRKFNGKVQYFVQIYKDFIGWEDVPGLRCDSIAIAMTAMDNALTKNFAEVANDNDEQVIVEREYRN